MSIAHAVATLTRRLARCSMTLTVLSLLTACVPASTVAPDGAAHDRVPSGAYYLRTVDGRPLPLQLPSGERIESGFVVSDSVDAALIGFGESIGRNSATSARLATGTARVIGQNYRSARITAIRWSATAAGVPADSVLWSVDSVIVYRTGSAPSVAGAGHRLIYTRATPADTL